MPDVSPLFRPGCCGRALICLRSTTFSIPLVCTLLLSGCPGGSSPPVRPPAATSTSPAANAGANSSPNASSRPPGQPQRTPLDAHGVAFVDVAPQLGLRHDWPEQPRPIPIRETFGCGAAAFDADNDGWLDVLLVGDPHPVLFRNEAGKSFTDVTRQSGFEADKGAWTGCAIGDYDGDGLLDILVTGFHRLALWKNAGGMKFEPATTSAGLPPDDHGHWGASAGFMDLDGDGWLDLVVLHYVEYGPDSKRYCEFKPGIRSGCTPRDYVAEKGEIWRNTGQGSFEPVPESAAMVHSRGSALVLAFTDLDGDGRIDFYIGNDGLAADLMHNLGQMQFENIGFVSGVAVSENTSTMSAMGADWADYNRDGLLDLTVTNFQKLAFAVFRNLGNNLFTDAAGRTGVAPATKNRLGFGAKWMDFDNDGWPDISYVNGHVYDNAPEIEGPASSFRQLLSLFRNEQGRRFVDLVPALGPDLQRPIVGRGSATCDFNNDGRIDLLVVDLEGPVMLLENRTETAHHWLTLDLRDGPPNVFAYGARVIGRAGDQTWLAEVSPASSYLSSSDPRIHWGLGETSKIDTLTIRWPSGKEQTLRDVEADRILRIDAPP
ncbi:MAG: VCBS repeat-containing protein [Planctomycetia bacterium]|nr:VCBS repeat-containing protein [Planctomycetia bacterium]